jgi:AraC-like DNA-binding protein
MEMGTMAKALHVVPPRLAEIPEPSDYFEGRGVPSPVLPRNILLFARVSRGRAHRIPGYHHRFLLVVNWRGAARMQLDGDRFSLAPGSLILVLPYQLHQYTVPPSEKMAWLMTTFEGPDAAHYLALRNRPLPLTERLHQTARDMAEQFLDRRASARYRNQRLALLVASQLNEMLEIARRPSRGRRKKETSSGGNAERMERIARYIVEHSDQALTIGELAKTFAISTSHIRELFRRHIGLSLGEFTRRTRLHHACKSLAMSELSCSEVAERHGYSSLYAFSRTFKEAIGVGPSAYRKRLAVRD